MAIVAQALVTRASIRLVMAIGMTVVGAGILWAARVPVQGNYWAHLAGPFFLAGVITWGFVPVAIGALAGVTERDTGVASGLIDSSQQLGGAIGIAVASTVAASHSRLLLGQGQALANALTGGFHWAFAVCGFVALSSVPVALLLVRRAGTVPAAAGPQRPAPAGAAAD
jgi:MFS family permease